MSKIKARTLAIVLACIAPCQAVAACPTVPCQPAVPAAFCAPMQASYCATKACQEAVKTKQDVASVCGKARGAIQQTTPLLGRLDPKNMVYYRGVLTQYWNFVLGQISGSQQVAQIVVLHTGKSKTCIGSECPLGSDGFGGMGDGPNPEDPYYLSDIDFEHGSVEVPDKPEVKEVLRAVKAVLDDNQKALEAPLDATPAVISTFLVQGHVDPEEPKKLAKKRAAAVRDYLVKNGVDAKWLKTAIYTKDDWRISAVVTKVMPRLVKTPKKTLRL